MKNLYFTLFIFALLSQMVIIHSCTETKASGSVKTILPPALPALKQSELFNEDLVYNYLFDNEERNTDSLEAKSKEFFLKGIDLFRNQKHAAESVPLFLQSLEIYPSANTYNELGDAYFEVNNFDKALEAYRIAIRLNYQPLSETYFHMACIEAKREGNVGEFLNMALRNGFRDSLRFVSEPLLQDFRASATYQSLFMNYFTENASGKNPHFQTFLFSFPALGETFSITEGEVGAYDYKNELSYEYSDFVEEMENVSFGRDVSNIFVAVGTLKESPAYTAVLYKSVEMYADYPPVYTMLATFDSKTGQSIDKKVFACICSAESVKAGKYEKGIITVDEKERVWESPITEVSIRDNKVKEYKTVSTSKFSIQENGKIEELTVSAKN